MFNNTTLIAKVTSEVSIVAWSSTLLTASVAVLIVGLPLSAMSFVGAFKASIRKESTIIDWIIVFFNFGIIQTCLIGQVATIVRLTGHFTGNVDVRTACVISHFSKGFGALVVHSGLTAIAVLRFIYVLHPKIGFKINAHQWWFKLMIPILLSCLAVTRSLLDYLYNESSMYGFCMVDPNISLRGMIPTSTFLLTMGFFFALIAADFFLTLGIWNHIRKRNTEVAVAMVEACPRQKQHNLLTLQGTISCRIIATLGYFAFFLVRLFTPEYKDPLRDHFYVSLAQIFIYACITVLLPLVCIVQSPYIKEIFTKRGSTGQ